MGSLIHSIYSSVATHQFNEDDIPKLLDHARAANAKRDISGMLVYINGNFLQILEGDAQVVDPLVARIQRDDRHKRMSLLIRERITDRNFNDWSMGFQTLLPADVGELVGENDFFESANCLSALDPGLVKAVLLSFHRAQTGE